MINSLKDIYKTEDENGIRFSWNIWPNNNANERKLCVPIGCLYTPMKEIKDLPILGYYALKCESCACILNPYVYIDFTKKFWTCWNCQTRNQFPDNYSKYLSKTNLPAELVPNNTTVEYEIEETNSIPMFFYIVDTAISYDNLK